MRPRQKVKGKTAYLLPFTFYLFNTMAFTGFTTDKLVGLPPELFNEVLPLISLPSELKVTLHAFYRMSRLRGGAPRRVSWDDASGFLRRGYRSQFEHASFSESGVPTASLTVDSQAGEGLGH